MDFEESALSGFSLRSPLVILLAIDIPTQQPWLFPSPEYFTLKGFVQRKLEIPDIPLKNSSNDPGLHTDLPIPLGAPTLANFITISATFFISKFQNFKQFQNFPIFFPP
jgi:hypothetical protein